MPVQTVLFDADGVVQRPHPKRRSAWQALLGSDASVEDFVTDLFAVERLAVAGQGDFVAALPEVLNRWGCCGTVEDALAAWIMIDPDPIMTKGIRGLRQQGILCHLASNQEPHRAAYMSRVLDYRGLFDREFYSCHLGVAKPAVEYFEAIIKALKVDPSTVLFLDDRADNVESARTAGLHGAEFVLDSTDLTSTLRKFGVRVI